ncbi:MAG: site-specific integrase [Lutisporaceae bacterium]
MSDKKTKEPTHSPDLQKNDEQEVSPTAVSKQPKQFLIGAKAKVIVGEFKQYLEDDSKAKSTIRSYIFDINSFVEYIEETKKREFTGQFDSQEYHDYLKYDSDKGSKPATLNKRINSIQSFNQWLIEKKLMTSLVANQRLDKISLISVNS